MLTGLRGRVAIVGGGSADVGRSVAVAFGAAGARVVVTYYGNGDGAARTVDDILFLGGEAFAWPADARSEEDVSRLAGITAERWGRIDIVVNNARAKIGREPLLSSGWESFDSHLQVSLKGVFLMSKYAVPHMKKNGYGRIINILNSVMMNTPVAGYTAFASALASVIGLSRTLAVELGASGITVNNISPGFTVTSEMPFAPEHVREKIRLETPLKRLAVPEDIANTALFLASDMAGFITGTTINLDGGKTF